MIAIKSIESDVTTIDVSRWLQYFGAKHSIVNELPAFDKPFTYNSENNAFRFADHNFNFGKTQSFWYRKGSAVNNIEPSLNERNNNNHEISLSLRREISDLSRFYLYTLAENGLGVNTNCIGDVNKLIVLRHAISLGLDVPPFIVTNNKKELEKFIANNRIIVKAISNATTVIKEQKRYFTYTTELDSKKLRVVPDLFFPTFFQRLISKEYDVRSFLLDRKFYSMAIVGVGDRRNEIDFRKYSEDSSERNVTYKLPKVVEKKLQKLADKLELSSGSFDLLFADGKYYFLEVNPVGQFGMVSQPCNFHLELKVAKKLISYL